MAKRNGKNGGRGRNRRGGGRRRPAKTVAVRPAASGSGWVLVHPTCVRERAEDLEEVHEMITAGELEVAVDELRWLLEDCSDFLEAHQLLGELALELDKDLALARAHFGVGYELGEKALRKAGNPRPVRYREPANQAFFVCGRQLAICLANLGEKAKADSVLTDLLDCDPSDPLNVKPLLDALKAGQRPCP